MQNILIYRDEDEVQSKLEELDLTISELQQVVEANFRAQASRTGNDAPTASGFYGWNDAVRTLREILVTKGWKRENIKNSPRINHPENDRRCNRKPNI